MSKSEERKQKNQKAHLKPCRQGERGEARFQVGFLIFSFSFFAFRYSVCFEV
jgi:hypothetical protein